MNCDQIILSITNAVKIGLPGQNAHLKALPESRRTSTMNFNPDNAKKSAVLILLYPQNGSWCLPFIQRTIDGTVHSGQIAFPGGKFEPCDADFTETALREAEEEIGILKKDVIIINKLSPLFIPVSNYVVYPVIGFLDYTPQFEMFADEVADIHVVDIQVLMNTELEMKTVQAGNLEIKVPVYLFENFEVWGATAMILTEFTEILKLADIFKNNQ